MKKERWKSLRGATVRAEIEFPWQQAGAGPAPQFFGRRFAILLRVFRKEKP